MEGTEIFPVDSLPVNIRSLGTFPTSRIGLEDFISFLLFVLLVPDRYVCVYIRTFDSVLKLQTDSFILK